MSPGGSKFGLFCLALARPDLPRSFALPLPKSLNCFLGLPSALDVHGPPSCCHYCRLKIIASDLFNSSAEPPRCEIVAYLEPRPLAKTVRDKVVKIRKQLANRQWPNGPSRLLKLVRATRGHRISTTNGTSGPLVDCGFRHEPHLMPSDHHAGYADTK